MCIEDGFFGVGALYEIEASVFEISKVIRDLNRNIILTVLGNVGIVLSVIREGVQVNVICGVEFRKTVGGNEENIAV